MTKLFDNKQQIVDALLNNGYVLYGENDNIAFKKVIRNPSKSPMLWEKFHAIIDYNYPLLNLHIDGPIRKKIKHYTIQKHPRIESEMQKILNKITCPT